MKIKHTKTLIFLIALSCSTEDNSVNRKFENYSGIWVPYKIIHEDGTFENGPFTASNFFGAYDESVELNEEDKKYIPVNWINKDTYSKDTAEGGNLTFVTTENRLIFTDGSWYMEFEIVKYSIDELWLKDLGFPGNSLYKFKRKTFTID